MQYPLLFENIQHEEVLRQIPFIILIFRKIKYSRRATGTVDDSKKIENRVYANESY